jgi:hypothetical protein
MNYDLLEKVICDAIKEEQIKLGYEKETIRLYYPMHSLAHILEEDIVESVGMDEALNTFADRVESKLGKVQVSHNGDRYCILIPPAGAAYVNENYSDNPFLVHFIDTIRKHDCTLEQILEVFHSFSDQVACEKSETDEFDYVIYFKDSRVDDYRYCVKFDYGHTSYHRFSVKDFEFLLEDSQTIVNEEPSEPIPVEEEIIDLTKEEKYQRYLKLMKAIRCMTTCNDKLDMYKKVTKQFNAMADYKDCAQLAEECKLLAKDTKKKIKKKIYKNALNIKDNAKYAEDYKKAAEEFRKISGYKDSDDLASECDTLLLRTEKRVIQQRVIGLCLVGVSVVAAIVIAILWLIG